ncbi:MAG: WG repeat-containing protein, partial [Clostridia bacterium]|nr:WG repeat-containing protein [Clostridia bacterium]
MKKRISLILALLLVVGSMSTLVACTTGDDTTPDDEVSTQDRTPSRDEDTTEKAGGDVTTDGKDPFGGNDQNGGEDTTAENSGETESPRNYTVDRLEDFNEGIVVYQGTMTAEDGSQTVGYGYMDSTGKVITPPIYEKACVFYNGLAAVVKGENQKGYIDTTGKEVIPCIYSSITMAIDTLTWVTTTDGVEQMINTKGEVVYTATGKETAKGYYQNGFFWIETVEVTMQGNIPTLTYYNEKGKVAFELKNTEHADFQKYGYWNRLESNFNEHGYAVVTQYEGGCKLIDKNGNYQDWIFEGDNTAGTFSITNDYLLYDGHDPAYFIDWKNQKVTWSFNNGSGSYLSNGYYGERSPYVHENGIYKIIWNQSTQTYLALGTDKYSDMANYEEFHYTNIDELQNLNVTGVAYGAQINGKDCFWISIRSKSNVMFTALADIDGNWIIEPTSAYETIYAYRPENAVSSYDSHALYGFSNGL